MADGTNQDALPSGGQPSDKESPSQPQTYTQDQLDKLISERHSKLDKSLAALTKERDTLKSSHESLSAEFAELQRRIEEEEEARYKDDPQELDVYQRRKKVREAEAAHKKRQSDLDARETALKDREAKAAQVEWEGLIFEVATAAKGNAETLRKRAADLGITDPEKLKTLAVTLWPQTGDKPDSGKSEGGGGELTIERIEKMTAEEYANHPSVKSRYK
jgi:vacuolar-type H+-ATPase subunit I/STV1